MKRFLSFYLILTLCLSCQFQNPSTKEPLKEQPTQTNALLPKEKEILTLSDFFIKTYQGTIDGKDKIEISLMNNTAGSLIGYCIYGEESERRSISGEIDLDESFMLQEDATEKNPKGWFEGSIADPAILKGSWTDQSTKKAYPFELKELVLEDSNQWTGTWHYNDIWDGGILVIGNVRAESFDFSLDFNRSGHLGSLFDKAVVTGNTATFKSTEFDKEACILVFTKHENHIEIDQQSPNFVCGFGARANASGSYDNQIKKEKPNFSYGAKGDIFATKEQHDSFKKLVGNHYEDIAFNFQTQEELNLESGDPSNAKAYAGRVMGALSVKESFIMHTPDGKFWIASLGDDGTQETRLVRYFTTEPKQKNDVPLSLKKWLINFGPHALIRE